MGSLDNDLEFAIPEEAVKYVFLKNDSVGKEC